MANTTTEELGAVLSAGGTQTLGALVFWSLSAAHIPRAEFRAEIEKLGLESALERDPSAKGALGRAVPNTFSGRKGILARRLPKGWAIVREKLVVGQAADYAHVVTLTANGDAMEITYLNDYTEELLVAEFPGLLATLREQFDAARSYIQTPDLSEFLSAAINGSTKRGLFSALSLRERTGGLYFVHGSQVERLMALRGLLARLAPHCTINVMRLTGDSENLSQAAQAARVTFSAQLATLRNELSEFKASRQAEGREVSDAAVTVRMGRFRELSDRVALFRDVLGEVTTELETEITTARDVMVAELEAV